MNIVFTIQPPYQFMVGLEFFPQEVKNGELLYNELSFHFLLFSMKFEW